MLVWLIFILVVVVVVAVASVVVTVVVIVVPINSIGSSQMYVAPHILESSVWKVLTRKVFGPHSCVVPVIFLRRQLDNTHVQDNSQKS